MHLLQQDLFVVLQLAALRGAEPTTHNALAGRLHLCAPDTTLHAGVQRGISAGLLDTQRRVQRRALCDFLFHGVRDAFFADRSAVT